MGTAMSRFSFAIDPNFVAQNRYGTEPPKKFGPGLSLFSWTMLGAVALATGAAALVWFL